MNAIQKTLGILNLLQGHPDGLRTGEISKALGITRPTASRLLGYLKESHYVQYQSTSRNYMLGIAALEMGRTAYAHAGARLIPIAAPHMRGLCDSVGESVILEVRTGSEVVIVERINGPQPIQVLVPIGTTIPLHVSPGGKSILAHMDQEEIEQYLKEDLASFTPKTITDRRVLLAALEKIRKDEFATSDEEYMRDTNAYGAAVFNKRGEPVAAIVITLPLYRVSSKNGAELISSLKKTARAITKKAVTVGL
jgi:DNA-binding IclR family transcriptional regulator